MRHRIKIDDVARLAGVSTATVSRTLNLPEVVSSDTREKVLQAIAATGYTQHASAQNLRRMRANSVLVLVPDIGNTFFAEILAGIEEVASANGMTILIGDTRGAADRESEFLTYLASGRADGILALNGHLPASARALAIVSISEELDNPSVPHIGIDNTVAACTATRHLIELGHKRICYVEGPPSNILTKQRYQGYRRAMAAAGLGEAFQATVAGDFTAASGERAAASILSMDRRPTGIFCANDEMAMGLISVLHANGVEVPGEVSVVGFDDIAFARTYIPALTTIRQPRHATGAGAMRLLLDEIGGKNVDRPAPRVQLKADLIVRRSTARASS